MSSLGFTLIICTAIGVAIGIFIDRFFKCAPWGTLSFFLIGTVAGFWQMFKETMRSYDDAVPPKK